jgi:hypothetical protein
MLECVTVWVPAFAGTTQSQIAKVPLESVGTMPTELMLPAAKPVGAKKGKSTKKQEDQKTNRPQANRTIKPREELIT